MKRKGSVIACVLLVLTLALTGCGFFMESSEDPPAASRKPTEEQTTVIRDPNGMPVPIYEDVDRTELDPEKFYKDEKGRIAYEDPDVVLYHGIDVSAFQEEIDWQAVKDDGIDFVMLRAGGRGWGDKGILYQDKMFKTNYTEATKAGLKVGVYFFSQALSVEEAEEEANYLLDLIKNLQLTYPIAYDWEHIEDEPEARTNNVPKATITACACKFLDVIHDAGYDPVLYFSRKLGYFYYDLSLVKDYDFWLAEFTESPAFIYTYKIWQYSDCGTVNGINGTVDLNVSYVDFSQEMK
ncbi:MAG: glycoside hydrolase family 25 protein [Clostridia bacterium]|nr:glycoside hydrolase family 25 protein [Clostridia bacterium]